MDHTLAIFAETPNLGLTEYAVLAVLVLSFGVWFSAIRQKIRTGSILPFDERPAIAWGSLGFILATVYVGMAVAGAIGELFEMPKETMPTGDSLSVGAIVAFGCITLGIIAATQIALRMVFNIPWKELGWPTNLQDWFQDIALGFVASLAALGLVFSIQLILVQLNLTTRHSLIEAFQENPSNMLFAAVGFAAVVAAPIFEELLFRQLVQGWLERLEDDLLGWRKPTATVEYPTEQFSDEKNDLITTASEDSDLCDEVTEMGENPAAPPKTSITALPYGFFPIVGSSILFALAHAGQGYAPIPLFFLALLLGYIFHRTHRIVPCIVVHMLFNGFNMLILALQVNSSSAG